MDLDAGSQVQVLLSGTRTTVLTRLNRQDLVDYLKRLTEALESKIDTQDQSDVLSADMTTLPSGDTVWEVVMQLDVF